MKKATAIGNSHDPYRPSRNVSPQKPGVSEMIKESDVTDSFLGALGKNTV